MTFDLDLKAREITTTSDVKTRFLACTPWPMTYDLDLHSHRSQGHHFAKNWGSDRCKQTDRQRLPDLLYPCFAKATRLMIIKKKHTKSQWSLSYTVCIRHTSRYLLLELTAFNLSGNSRLQMAVSLVNLSEIAVSYLICNQLPRVRLQRAVSQDKGIYWICQFLANCHFLLVDLPEIIVSYLFSKHPPQNSCLVVNSSRRYLVIWCLDFKSIVR